MSNALELYAIIRLLNVNLPELREVRGVGGKEIPGSYVIVLRLLSPAVLYIDCKQLPPIKGAIIKTAILITWVDH